MWNQYDGNPRPHVIAGYRSQQRLRSPISDVPLHGWHPVRRSGAPLPRNVIGNSTVECRDMRAPFPVTTFAQRRQELEDLGFDSVEWHLGHEAELVDSGIVPLEDIDVIVARFVRQSDNDN